MLTGKFIARTLGILIAATQLASAQEGEAVFEEIVVTAQKRAQSIYDVPAAISAFTSETLQQQGISNIADVGKFVPNLTITNFSGGSAVSSNPFIRGIGIQDHLITTDPGVGVYLDGVYLGRQVGQNWSLANIERLEVLRGPQGTLYGRNSIGGAVNIITRKPGEENTANVALEGGSRGHVNSSAYGSYRVSNELAVSAAIAYKRRNGLGKFTNLSENKNDVGEYEDISGRLNLLWTSGSDDLSVLFSFDGNDGSSGLNPYHTTILAGSTNNGSLASGTSEQAADIFDNATGEEELADNRNASYGISLTLDYVLNDNLSTRILTSRRKSTYQAGLDDDGTAMKVHDYGETGEATQTSFELQVNGEYDAVDFVSGLYYFEEEGKNQQPRTTFNGGGGSFLLSQQLHSYAVFANAGYTFNERLRVAAGVRYSYDKKTAQVDFNNFVQANAKENFDEISWALTANYSLTETISVYANVQNGYQSGQFPPRPYCLFEEQEPPASGMITASNCFNQPLENITALNIEGGIKGTFFERLQGSLTVFHTQYSDLPYPVSTTVTAGFSTVNLIVDQDSTGAELEGRLLVWGGLYLNGSLGYIDQKIKKGVADAVAPLTPEMTYSISPEYSFPLSGGGTVSMRADYSYRGDFYGEPSRDPGRNTKVASRGLLNFNIGYLSADEIWSVSAYGRNVLDKRYESARLNTEDYILAILANDASEFGVRFTRKF